MENNQSEETDERTTVAEVTNENLALIPGGDGVIKGQVTAILLRGMINDQAPGNATELVSELLQLYHQWKVIFSTSHSDLNFENFVVCNIVKVCYMWNVDDSNLVAESLRCLYRIHGHFRIIFQCFLENEENPLSLSPPAVSASPLGVHTCGYPAIEYFLRKANEVQLQFDGARFIDISMWPNANLSPIDYAIECENHNMLMLLCRYGALVKRGEENSTGANIDKALKHLICELWTQVCKDGLNNDIIQCVRILLRIVSYIKPSHVHFPLYRMDRNTVQYHVHSTEFVRQLVNNGIFPKFLSRFAEPSELQHVCRCALRKILWQNWQLPEGIYQLPIPAELIKYIDLQWD